MISYIANLLGISNLQSGSVEYYCILFGCLDVVIACSITLIRYLLSPIDLLSKYKERK